MPDSAVRSDTFGNLLNISSDRLTNVGNDINE